MRELATIRTSIFVIILMFLFNSLGLAFLGTGLCGIISALAGAAEVSLAGRREIQKKKYLLSFNPTYSLFFLFFFFPFF